VVTLAAFGAFAAVLAVGLTAQSTWRVIRVSRGEAAVLRSLGAGPRESAAGPCIAAGLAVLVGAALAVAGAVALSPLAPIGTVRHIEPHPGLSADLVALVPGALALIATGAAAALLAGPRLLRPDARPAPSRRRLQPPLPIVLGVRNAFGRRSAGGRSAVTAAVVATIAVVGTLAFTTDLRHLTRTPRLFGADFDVALQIGAGYTRFDPAVLDRYLAEHADGQVTAWASMSNDIVRVGDALVPVYGLDAGQGVVSPSVDEGRAPARPGEIALGAETMAALGLEVGDEVDVAGQAHTVVGTAVLPALGQATGDHPTLGTGGWLTGDGLRSVAPDGAGADGASAVLLRLGPGADLDALVADMDADPAAWGISEDEADEAAGGIVSPLRPPRPGELIGISPAAATPAVMAALLATGALLALAFALVASVRTRRRDLAVLKALGFTGRQLSAMVETQALVTVLVGAVIGVPLGLALGSTVWRLFAEDLGVLVETRIPAGLIVLTFVLGLVAALAVTALPSRSAGRTSAALVLRSE
jgi:hypothetical protein